MKMRVINDFDYRAADGVEQYSMRVGSGTAAVRHRHFPFGVSVNLNDFRCDGFSNRDRVGDVNMVGITVCLLGSADCTVGSDSFRMIPGTGMIGRPSSELNTLSFPAGRYRGISVGFVPSEIDLPPSEPSPEDMVLDISNRIGGPYRFRCSPDILAAAYGIDIALEHGGPGADDVVRGISGFLLRALNDPIGRPPVTIGTGRHDGLIDSICIDMMDGHKELRTSCSERGEDPTVAIRRFHGRYGATPSMFVRSQRLARAAGDILAGSTVMKDVAARAGYSSESKFAISFKELYGIRPKHYRDRSIGPCSRV